MRINVYSQELTDEVLLVEKRSNTGIVYHAAQLVLHSSPMLHHPPQDDDRSAVTFWLPRSPDRREAVARAFERMAEIFRTAPPASGLDSLVVPPTHEARRKEKTMLPITERAFMQELRDTANGMAAGNLNPDWVRAYAALADAADRLDAM